MTGVAISALPAATASNPTDVVPVVQGGVTKKMPLSVLIGLSVFNVKQYGAVGGGSTDDTAAIQSAINACRTAGGGVVYYPGPASYKVTLSLNSTNTVGNQPIFHVGDGKFISRIVHTFPVGEPYPVIDGCGNTRGGTIGLSIVRGGTSYATCAYLAAKDAAGDAGNTQGFFKSFFDAGNVVGDCALVIYNTDLSRAVDCEITSGYSGGGGLSMGFAKPANIASKFITPSSALDWTQGYIDRCEVIGDAAPALAFTGGAAISISDSYFALIGNGSSKIIEVTSPSGSSGNAIYAKAMRTENQSSATGVASLFFTAGSAFGVISGELETDSSGHMIGSGINPISDYTFNIAGATGSMLSIGDGGILATSFVGTCGSGGIGSCSSTGVANSWGLSFAGGFNAGQLLTLFGATPGLSVKQGGLRLSSLYDVKFPPTNTSISGAGKITIAEGAAQTTSYTGGSGANNLFTAVLRLSAVSLWSTQLPGKALVYRAVFNCNAFGSGGTFAVTLTQGSNTTTLASFTPPTANAAVELEVELYTASNPAIIAAAKTKVTFDATAPAIKLSTSVNGAGITPALGDATLAIMATSSANIAQAQVAYVQEI